MLSWIQNGTAVFWLLAAISVVSLCVFFNRLFHLHRAQMKAKPRDFLNGIFNVLRRKTPQSIAEAITICQASWGPVPEMTRAALLEIQDGPIPALAAMERTGLAEIERLESGLNLLLTMAQIAPICGLIGTVLGLLNMLTAIMQKAPLIHAGDLGVGMWNALLSTGVALVITLVVYVFYNILVGRVESIVLNMERAILEVQGFFFQYFAERKSE